MSSNITIGAEVWVDYRDGSCGFSGLGIFAGMRKDAVDGYERCNGLPYCWVDFTDATTCEIERSLFPASCVRLLTKEDKERKETT